MNSIVRRWLGVLVAVIMLAAARGWAASDGAWSATSGGLWTNEANWAGSTVATGTSATAYFTNGISATSTVTNDVNWTVGNLVFTPPSTSIGWTVTNSGSVSLTLAGAAPVITVTGTTNAHVASVYTALAGSSGVNINGGGKLVLGTNNTYTGGTTISNVTVQVAGIAGALGSGTAGAVTINGGTLVSAAPSTFTPTWPLTIGSGGATLIPGAGGAWQLSANTLLGSGTVTLRSGGGNRVQNLGQSTFAGKWIVATGGLFDFPNNSLGTATGDDVMTVTNNSQLLGNSSTAFMVGNATQGIYLAGAGQINQSGNSTAPMILAGKISGPGALVLTTDDNNTVIIVSNANNSWSGDVDVTSGQSLNQSPVRLGTSETLPHGAGKGNVKVQPNGILDLNGQTETINGLFGTGKIQNWAAGAATLILGDNNATNVFSGTIINSNGIVNLIKIGTGIQTLSGTNTYSGVTIVSNGVLAVTNVLSLSTNTDLSVISPAIVNLGGKTQTVVSVGGSGLVSNGMLNVASALFPGGSNAVGTLTVTNLTLAENAVLWWDYSAGGSDTNRVLGTANLPTNLTVHVSGTGSFPSRGVLFVSGTNVAPAGVGRWSVIGGKSSSRVIQQGNMVQIVTTTGTILTLN